MKECPSACIFGRQSVCIVHIEDVASGLQDTTAFDRYSTRLPRVVFSLAGPWPRLESCNVNLAKTILA